MEATVVGRAEAVAEADPPDAADGHINPGYSGVAWGLSCDDGRPAMDGGGPTGYSRSCAGGRMGGMKRLL